MMVPSTTAKRERPRLRGSLLAIALWAVQGGCALAGTADITNLSNVTFTNLDPMIGVTSSQNLCVYSDTTRYAVTASGSGAGSAFTLSAGGAIPPLPYSVAWSSSGYQTSGAAMSPSVPLSGQVTLATSILCLIGLASSASLTVSIASLDLQSAVSGVTYTGVLSLTVAAQ